MQLPSISVDNLSEGAFQIKQLGHLLGAKSNFCYVNQVSSTQGPTFDGNPDEFIDKNGKEALKIQLKNKVNFNIKF